MLAGQLPAAAAAASADSFDDLYLGAKSSDPSQDNDGDSLTEGDLYFNSSSDQLMVYTGSAWAAAAIASSGFATLTGSETFTNKTLTSPIFNTGVSGTAIKDEDNMASNSADHLSTQQSIKAYIHSQSTTGLRLVFGF